MDIHQFEQLLILNAQGNCPNYNDVLNSMMSQKEDLQKYVELLFSVIFSTENKIALKQAMVSLGFLVCEQWKNLSDELREKAITSLINIFKDESKIDDSETIYIFAQLICNIEIGSQSDGKIIGRMLKELENSGDRSLTLNLSVVVTLIHIYDFVILERWYPDILQLIMLGLNDKTEFSNVVCGIQILTQLLDFFPDERRSTEEHIDKAVEIANDSVRLGNIQFLLLWKNICALCYAAASDKSLVLKFHPAIISICENQSVPADFKIYPLRTLWACPGEYDRPEVHEFISLSIKIAAEYVQQANSLPFEFLFMLDNCADVFEHVNVYTFLREKIKLYLESELQNNRIVGLCLLKYVLLDLPHQCVKDADEINRLLIKALQSSNHLVLDACCIAIASISASVASNLTDVDSLFPLCAPLLIHENIDIRIHANDACIRLLDLAQAPLYGITLMVFKLINRVSPQEISKFLLLLGKCIKHDQPFEVELANHFSNFTMAMLQYKDNVEMVSGACYVAECLMRVNENCHNLLPKTLEAIAELLQYDSICMLSFGVSLVKKLINVFPDEGSALFQQFKERIGQALQFDDNTDPIFKQRAIIDIANIEARNKDSNHPFAMAVYELSMEWLSSNQPAFVGAAIQALKKLQLILPNEYAIKIFQELAYVCINSKSLEVACASANAMAYGLKNCSNEAHHEMEKIGDQVGLSYIKGEMVLLQGVSPLGTDFDFELLYQISMLICELFDTPSEIIRTFFPFMCSIIAEQNNIKTEIMLQCLASAISHGTLIESEINHTANYAVSLLVKELPLELICNESKLLVALLDKNILSWNTLNEKLEVFTCWFDRCNEAKYRMKITMSNLVLLLWKVCLNFNARKYLPELIPKTIHYFPPDDLTLTAEMIRLTKLCISNDTDVPSTIYMGLSKKLMKILMISQLILSNRGVTPDLLEIIKSTLHFCRKECPEVQKFINDYSSQSPSRSVIFQQFVE